MKVLIVRYCSVNEEAAAMEAARVKIWSWEEEDGALQFVVHICDGGVAAG
ncbi:hypothetical protein DEO72_LG6g1275 [Vigna unguiculata]|uniref:Uncharacterized protein n=1 Tax=Vigna unguiculata TaxID=3917 RepID=A0A4D6M5C5_VIGUN|nr:hypothetical protein DEO72_LG6g1275 [Vigna unguiculata]